MLLRHACPRRLAGIGMISHSFRVFTTEEGGSQHCQRDYLTLGNRVIFDWLAETL